MSTAASANCQLHTVVAPIGEGMRTSEARGYQVVEQPNQSLQQTKPPVTVRADARPAPAVFAAEARC